MTDANALANLQILMNSVDGRYEVLNELLSAGTMSREINQGENIRLPEQFSTDNINLSKRLKNRKDWHPIATESRSELPENIIALLDRLSVEDKVPLAGFVDGLAYHYNDLFMGLIGHLSIVMHRIEPTHPSYHKLSECEELIMNTAMLIRFLVDVFRNDENQKEVLYPMDPSDHDIYRRVFPKHIFNYSNEKLNQSKNCVQMIMVVVAGIFAKALKQALKEMYLLINEAFQYPELEENYYIIHYFRGMVYLNKGFQLVNNIYSISKD